VIDLNDHYVYLDFDGCNLKPELENLLKLAKYFSQKVAEEKLYNSLERIRVKAVAEGLYYEQDLLDYFDNIKLFIEANIKDIKVQQFVIIFHRLCPLTEYMISKLDLIEAMLPLLKKEFVKGPEVINVWDILFDYYFHKFEPFSKEEELYHFIRNDKYLLTNELPQCLLKTLLISVGFTKDRMVLAEKELKVPLTKIKL
jgi:hypothetical protein